MKYYRVFMFAFCAGEIRMVKLPENVEHTLDNIYLYGQNDIQAVKSFPSVSVGDVIEFNDEYFVVCPVGFKKLSELCWVD